MREVVAPGVIVLCPNLSVRVDKSAHCGSERLWPQPERFIGIAGASLEFTRNQRCKTLVDRKRNLGGGTLPARSHDRQFPHVLIYFLQERSSKPLSWFLVLSSPRGIPIPVSLTLSGGVSVLRSIREHDHLICLMGDCSAMPAAQWRCRPLEEAES